jgi:hypothetical protein
MCGSEKRTKREGGREFEDQKMLVTIPVLAYPTKMVQIKFAVFI